MSVSTEDTMAWFQRIPMASLAIVVGVISVIAWITLDGTVPLVISIIAGELIALRATVASGDSGTT